MSKQKIFISLFLLIFISTFATAQVTFDPMDIEIQAESGDIVEVVISITNEGQDLFEWSVPTHPLNGENYEPWELIRSYNFGEIVEDDRLYGVAFIGEEFYISGSNDGDPQIYVLNVEGELIRQFTQPGEDDRGRGIKDLTWDGELLWGAVDATIYGFTTWGEIEHEWEAPYNPTTVISWDSERDVFWVGATVADPVAMNRDGDIVELLELNRFGMRIYGLAYWKDSPDGNKLFVHHKDRITNQQMVMGLNPATGDSMSISTLIPEAGGIPQGAFVTDQYDNNNWVMMTVVSNTPRDGGDRVDIWQIRNNWYLVDEFEGSIEPLDTHQFTMSIGYESFEQRVYEAELTFLHNFDDGITVIPLSLEITELAVDGDGDNNLPQSFGIISTFPNPFNSSVTLSYNVPINSLINLGVYDINGSQVAELINGDVKSGIHTVTWDGSGQASGIYFANIVSNDISHTMKLMLIK